jgi:GT2 family glycosyltransferase
MSRAALSDMGAFDDDFFAYLEDVDWCLRARQKGYKVMFCPDARVRHRGSASTGWNSPQINYFYGRNSILFLKKHGKMIQRLTFLSAFLIAFMLRFLKCTSRGGVRNVLFSLAGMYDGFLKRRPRYEILGLR